MLGLFLPPVVAVIIGVVVLAVGLAVVHSTVLVAVGILAVAIGGVRYVRRRSGNGVQR
jgi:membrane protein implicated in regulation of membrane protease activity